MRWFSSLADGWSGCGPHAGPRDRGRAARTAHANPVWSWLR